MVDTEPFEVGNGYFSQKIIETGAGCLEQRLRAPPQGNRN